jgi:hypothetical protein
MPIPGAATRIEPMTGAHAAAVLAIYQAGIEEGNATFETCAPDWAAFTAARLPAHRFIAIAGGRVAGWVAAALAHRPSTQPFTSSALIRSNATLTLPSRQYTRYPGRYK